MEDMIFEINFQLPEDLVALNMTEAKEDAPFLRRPLF